MKDTILMRIVEIVFTGVRERIKLTSAKLMQQLKTNDFALVTITKAAIKALNKRDSLKKHLPHQSAFPINELKPDTSPSDKARL